MAELRRHIWLCGFMGCGKSTIGAALASLAGVSMIDTDAYIEQREQMTIPEIFDTRGEPYFRSLETAGILELGGCSPAVIATGGGMMVSEKNAVEAKKSGSILLLDIPFETCYQRIQDSDRPIVRRSSKAELQELYDSRRSLYLAHADLIFGQVLSPQESAKEIIRLIAAL